MLMPTQVILHFTTHAHHAECHDSISRVNRYLSSWIWMRTDISSMWEWRQYENNRWRDHMTEPGIKIQKHRRCWRLQSLEHSVPHTNHSQVLINETPSSRFHCCIDYLCRLPSQNTVYLARSLHDTVCLSLCVSAWMSISTQYLLCMPKWVRMRDGSCNLCTK